MAREKLTSEELEAANKSCDTCYFCRRPDYHSYKTWICESPANHSEFLNPVTGRYYLHFKTCDEARKLVTSHMDEEHKLIHLKDSCGPSGNWREAQFIVLDDGTWKHVDSNSSYPSRPITGHMNEPTTGEEKLRALKARLKRLSATSNGSKEITGEDF